MDLQPIVQTMAILGGGLALFTYWRNARLRRAEWLSSLHARFYESPNYKEMRRILDYESKLELDKLKEGLEGNSANDQLSESLVDYLNFFELIASLWQLRQVSVREIKMIFEYYILRLKDHDFVWRFICSQGFENLRRLIDELSPKG